MKPNQETDCGFKQREIAAVYGYWDDYRWEEVVKLRLEKKHAEANGIVGRIRYDYGVD